METKDDSYLKHLQGDYFSIKGREEFYRMIEEKKKILESLEDSELKI